MIEGGDWRPGLPVVKKRRLEASLPVDRRRRLEASLTCCEKEETGG